MLHGQTGSVAFSLLGLNRLGPGDLARLVLPGSARGIFLIRPISFYTSFNILIIVCIYVYYAILKFVKQIQMFICIQHRTLNHNIKLTQNIHTYKSK